MRYVVGEFKRCRIEKITLSWKLYMVSVNVVVAKYKCQILIIIWYKNDKYYLCL